MKEKCKCIATGWTEADLVALAIKAGMTISEEDFKTCLWSYGHAERLEKEIKAAGEKILLETFEKRWQLKK